MTTTRWNGAHRLLRAARARGIDICFANPGTTELTLVSALDDVPGIRPVLGLFEGVCTGAADGYARVSGKPALTLLHLGPGLANGLANLHNARRARSPVVNVVGDHATWHLSFDAPLTSDIDSFAKPVSKAVIYLRDPASLPAQLQEVFDVASGPNGGVVTVIAPTDVMDADVPEEEGSEQRAAPSSPAGLSGKGVVPDGDIDAVQAALAHQRPVILLLGADALTERGQRAAARVAGALPGRLLMESYPAIVSLGG
ncbi:thiamine pyrophosphate-binding protein [Nitrospirillum viridazoti]|nr:thiamine pyrophosphate-binding protein [Nitrospirillum amazonense]